MDSCQENKSLSQVMDSLTLVGTRYDDGYDSAASEEKSECSQEEEEEEEPILEPLCILEEKEEQSVVYIRYIYISKGLTDNRYCPYTVRFAIGCIFLISFALLNKITKYGKFSTIGI